MPPMTPFGWFHTIIAIIALISGVYSLIKFTVIRSDTRSGMLYLVCTVAAAASALGIYKHGGFGVAHVMAVATLAAVLVGAVAEKSNLFGGMSRYLQAAAYTFTFLTHMLPAVTDGLMRLPVSSPIVTSLDDPLMRGSHLAVLVAFLIVLALQIRWLRSNDG